MGVRQSGEDEEQVGEPVQVDEHLRVQLQLLGAQQDVALRPATDRPRDVKPRSGLRPAGQDEALELGQVAVERVAELLEPLDHPVLDAQAIGHPPWHRQVRADVEELVLDELERVAHRFGHVTRQHDADRRIELVDRAESTDPAVELRDARSVTERRLARVAAARVDPRQPHRLVTAPHAVGAGSRCSSRMLRAITRRWISLVPS